MKYALALLICGVVTVALCDASTTHLKRSPKGGQNRRKNSNHGSGSGISGGWISSSGSGSGVSGGWISSSGSGSGASGGWIGSSSGSGSGSGSGLIGVGVGVGGAAGPVGIGVGAGAGAGTGGASGSVAGSLDILGIGSSIAGAVGIGR